MPLRSHHIPILVDISERNFLEALILFRFANHKEQAPGRPRAYDYFIMLLYVTVPVGVPVEAFKAVSLTPLTVFSALLFGNQVIESSKITHNSSLFRLGWQSWGQGFDPPQLHQNKRKGLTERSTLFVFDECGSCNSIMTGLLYF